MWIEEKTVLLGSTNTHKKIEWEIKIDVILVYFAVKF